MKQVVGGRGSGSLPFSPAFRAGDYVFVSGQVVVCDDGMLVEGGQQRTSW